MIETLGLVAAQELFKQLPSTLQLFTLSPAYASADAGRISGIEPVYVCYREEAAFWLHSVHRDTAPGEGWFSLQSPYGYGGPLANSEEPAFLARAWNSYQQWCKDTHILAESVSFHPLAGNQRFYGGEANKNRNTVAIPLNTADEAMAAYEPRCRTAIRKATAAGVTTRWLDAAENSFKFASFYRAGMANLGARPFYFFPDFYFSALSALIGVQLLVCELNGEWISAGFFLEGADFLEYHLSTTTELGRKLAATNLLLHAATEWARKKELGWLYLGGGTDVSENNPLLKFKSSFSDRLLPFVNGFAIHAPKAYEQLRATSGLGEASAARVPYWK